MKPLLRSRVGAHNFVLCKPSATAEGVQLCHAAQLGVVTLWSSRRLFLFFSMHADAQPCSFSVVTLHHLEVCLAQTAVS